MKKLTTGENRNKNDKRSSVVEETGAQEDKFLCEGCLDEFDSLDQLEEHIQRNHAPASFSVG